MKEEYMKVFNCTCGGEPEHETHQHINIIRCNKCNKEKYHSDYHTCVRGWNNLNAVIKYENLPGKACPLEFYVQQSELAK